MKKTAQLFKALSDETRLRILALLEAGELCVCDLMAVLELPQSTVSRHLATLRNAGLVEDRRQGIWMYYRLTPSTGELSTLVATLPGQLADLTSGVNDRKVLQAYLQKKNAPGCC
jgi:ArsR family transcriptional regulator